MKKLNLLGGVLILTVALNAGNIAMAHKGGDITVTGKVASAAGVDGKSVLNITDDKTGKTYTIFPSRKMGTLPDSIKAGETASVYGDPIVHKDGSLSLRVEKVK